MTDLIIPPATAARVISGDTPCWEQSLAKHHAGLVKAGVTTWADEGKKLVPPPRPRKKKPTVTGGMTNEV